MNIYIAVLFICLGDNCNFMQGSQAHKTELQCRQSVDQQKAQLTEMAQLSKDTEITILEGTCIAVTLKTPGKTV
jgi:hypothetical protein